VLEKAGAQTLIIMMTNLKYVNALGHFFKDYDKENFKTKISLLHLGE